MLDAVSRGKDLAEKQLIILGTQDWAPLHCNKNPPSPIPTDLKNRNWGTTLSFPLLHALLVLVPRDYEQTMPIGGVDGNE